MSTRVSVCRAGTRIPALTAVILLAATVVLSSPVRAGAASVQLHDFLAGGPVTLTLGDTAHVCTTNLNPDTVAVLLAILRASDATVLAFRNVTLASGSGACLDYAPGLVPGQGQGAERSTCSG